MNRLEHKRIKTARRKDRVRARINGTSDTPRLSLYVSNRHLTAQLIDDSAGRTLIYLTTAGKKSQNGKLTEAAAALGSDLAKKAKAKKINKVVFDRGSKLYHGRVKALADAAREGGLEF